MHHVDVPPVWLLAFGLAAWTVARWDPLGLTFGGAWADLVAGLLIGGGLLLILVAVAQMRQARTAVLPRREASAFVTNGAFGRSRNPIYLGMALILLGWTLRLDQPLALPLLPLFMALIERRFIDPEEEALARRFPAAWTRYAQATRRWL
ncbi:isoprenylcysteine carboxyl methyltransferase family protein [Rubellimicrobium mesophilum DSM 19309]|uniref:Isoprenylcysteine carboxyl methyltransferase family protein n=1 Tax=Rubellimicrobium mesophilum DSM 19309 TaxID=442562 RepID=A0A017HRM6_9RHOB|nr:methyltransferase [Rubellimicrobium mesophilum]EYD77137.1 isoprenylcysteine carboxyl methyltransferase family protein [Rubellimicrobium mesophilum DSM 19309]